MVVRLSDLMAAEKRLDDAVEERDRYQREYDEWGGFESLDRQGRRHLNLRATHFQRLERLDANVVRAEQQLRALQRVFAAGGDVGAAPEMVVRGQ